VSIPVSTELFVSPTGNDHWSGANRAASGSAGPLASLNGALERIRELRMTSPETSFVVSLLEGAYVIDSSVLLTSDVSGSPEAPLVIRSECAAGARLIGGRILTPTELPSNSNLLSRIPQASRDHLKCYDLADLPDLVTLSPRGFGRKSVPSHSELFQNHERLTLSRYPNDASLRISGTPAARDDDHGGELGSLEQGFTIDDTQPATWASLGHVWMHGYWGWDWADSYEQISKLDTETSLIETHPPHGVYGFRRWQPFYFLNIPEELDSPGEYYIDHQNQTACAWLREDAEHTEVAISTLAEPLIQLLDVNHVTIEGLVLEYGCGEGIRISNGTHINLVGLTVRNTGNSGIIVDGGKNHTVSSCDIYQVGEAGIDIAGGDRESLERSNHEVVNNHIHHFAEWIRCYRPGVKVSGVGIRIANNHIHDAPHNAILLTGNEHLIEKNHIHDVCYETGDSGAFYMGRDWTERGNVIRYNLIHDTARSNAESEQRLGSRAIYLDDCASGSVIHGNIFYNCTMAVFIGGGRNHRVTNNIFVDCEPAVVVDGRGMDEKDVWQRMVKDIMRPRFEAMNPLAPPYSVRYPDLREVAAYYFHELGVPPEGNLVNRNICIGEWIQVREPAFVKMIAIQSNFTYGDPGFADLANRDFHLDASSEVFKLGFKPIPLDEIGLFPDRHKVKGFDRQDR